jgi:sarcosine oxidase
VVDADEIHRRWPIFEPAADTVGLVEVQAGSVRIDHANAAHPAVAERHGARLEFGRRVVD